MLFNRFQRAGAYARKALRNFRGDSRLLAGRMVARLMGRRKYSSQLPIESISSVLICRINGRLGNTVLLTPLAKRIHELLPHASIDFALAYPKADELLHNFPGLRRIIVFPHKGPGLIQKYFGALRQLRAERYDVVVDPIPDSTGGRVALTLCRARYRVGFLTDSQWAPLTHAVSEPGYDMHQGLLPVFLLSQVIGRPSDFKGLQLTLCLRPEELESGRAALAKAIEPYMSSRARSRPATPRAFGFFAHATGLKVIERAWWLEFWKAFLELEPDAVPVEFLPSATGSPTDAKYPTVHFGSLRALTAAISATRMFISADTGPMHLASSTAVPTVALFCASDPALYGPLKSVDVAINITTSTPRLVAERCQRIWRESIRLEAVLGNDDPHDFQHSVRVRALGRELSVE
jgi:heptosyltransferase-3